MLALYWLIAIAILLVIEIITMGLTTIWFAGGSLIAFIIAMCGGPFWLQMTVFVIVSFCLLLFTRPVALRYLNNRRVKTNYQSIVGQEARVTEQIDNYNQTGTVVLNGQEWTARSVADEKKIEIDTKVIVKKVEGVKLIVEKQ